jgi:hypothetical protein
VAQLAIVEPRAVTEDNRIRMGSTLLRVYEMHDPDRTVTQFLDQDRTHFVRRS